MKIGMFTDAYHPVMNGVVNSIDLYSDCLREKGHEVIIFAPKFPGSKDEEGVVRLNTIEVPNRAGYRVFVPPFGKKAKQIFKQLDIFHVHHPYMGTYVVKHAKKYNKPLIFTHHTVYEEMARYFPIDQETSKGLIKWLVAIFCNKCDLIFVPNFHIRNTLRFRKVTKRIEILPTGVNFKNYKVLNGEGRNKVREEIRKKYNIGKEDKVLIYTGRIAKEKNLSLLLKAYRELCNKYLNLKLMIVGEGPERKWLHYAIKNIGLKNIILPGKVKYEHLPCYYAAADVFVFPSYIETQALVVIEAMAAGIPVVGINNRTNRTLIRHNVNGLLANNYNDFVKNVDRVLSDNRLRVRLINNSMRKVKEYGISRLTNKLVKEYINSMNRKN
ncbi:glycosyltransferase [Nanoarchaeota archaeon]